MKLLIKQRVFSWGSKFDIYDTDGRTVYVCQGEVFTWGKKLHIYDADGNEVVFIEQQLFRFLPHYDIHLRGQHFATLIKRFTFFVHKFYYEGLNWEIDGDFFAHDYRITCGGDEVLSIAKRWFSWGDTYELTLNENYNPLAALASAIVIDCINHSSSR